MHLNEQFILKALPGVSLLYKTFRDSWSYSVDTRTLKEGDIFVAMKGDHVDGHDYLKQAYDNGAAGCIIEKGNEHCLQEIEKETLKQSFVAVVPDTFQALIKLATAWRALFSYPVIAITGSVGKTSTKEKISAILDVAGKKYLATRGNQNTAIGLSLNILNMRSHHDVALFEIGINKRGEMKHLAHIAKPTIAVITTIGHSHMEGLGSLTDIAAEKRDIFSYFSDDNIGIVNGDQLLLGDVGYTHPVIKFGSKTTNQIQARKIHVKNNSMTFVLKLYGKKYPIVLKTSHVGAVYNALAAASVAYILNISNENIVKAVQQEIVITGRFEQIKLKNNQGILINDCYNASPESMKAALMALQNYNTQAKKIAVLGDMFELGVNSPFWHRQLGRFLRKVPSIDKVLLVGDMVKETRRTIPVGITVEHVASWQEASTLINKELKQESVILVKGSRAVGLDNLVNMYT